ncbi:MAG: hypothetical protein QOH33_228 [Paraburkholderia sp.]|nr:hypothetical protein [Paraburkholderia sp.]
MFDKSLAKEHSRRVVTMNEAGLCFHPCGENHLFARHHRPHWPEFSAKVGNQTKPPHLATQVIVHVRKQNPKRIGILIRLQVA